ncbi:Protein translocase subunit SecE [Alteripontixanthobacter maritimus]|uniref:Protein translocase subunit SecE n=1 Tax=Alteripontixanthobacter maritimus TaxID=2161824 RepID=A0A369Q6X9_9SPHN|nr:preprotein translocase subunit SecE [Alteripontixanthobacter maritimus]RDC60611.1 Protein translocase subunit SecE [Alteripontixanthobacter maritimus]
MADDRNAAKPPASAAPAKTRTSPGEFIRQVRTEASKVVWPTRQETITTAIFVGILTVILSLFFLGIDSVFGNVVEWLLTLA